MYDYDCNDPDAREELAGLLGVDEMVLQKVFSVQKNSLLHTDGFDNKKGFPRVGKLRVAVMRGKVFSDREDL